MNLFSKVAFGRREDVCYPVYTIQPVVKPVVKPVWQPVWHERTATVRSTGCQTGLYNWFDKCKQQII